jgi:hypothetical protein
MNKIKKKERILIKIISSHFGVNVDDVLGKKRKKRLVLARHYSIYFLRKKFHYTYEQIAHIFKTDHSSIMYVCEKIGKTEPPKELLGAIKIKVGNVMKYANIVLPPKTKFRHKYQWLFEIIGSKCEVCGFDDVIEVHHIVPIKEGGDESPSNLLILCPNHHSLIHAGLLGINKIQRKKLIGG